MTQSVMLGEVKEWDTVFYNIIVSQGKTLCFAASVIIDGDI